jgi:fructokinase
MDQANRFLLGVDFGGTKIEAALVDGPGAVVARQRIATPRDYIPAVKAVAALVDGLLAEYGQPHIPGIGMAIPGSMSPRSGLVRNANSTFLNGRAFGEDLAQATGRAIRLANDANCFALSEAIDGAGAGFSSVFGVILGTGCGGGLVIDGLLVEGAGLVAGEFGHTPLPWPEADEYPGPTCWCGKRGCLETWISGPAFEADFARSAGAPVPAAEIATRALDREPQAAQALDRLVDRIARGLSSVINIVDPAMIVLGGGLSNLPDLAPQVEARLGAYVFADHCATQVRPNVHGDSSGVRGAAWLFRNH